MYTAFLLAATTCLGWDGGYCIPCGGWDDGGGWDGGCVACGGWYGGGYGGGCDGGWGAQPYGGPWSAAAWGGGWGPMGGYGCAPCWPGYGPGYPEGCGRRECCLKRLCEHCRRRHFGPPRGCDYDDSSYGQPPWGGPPSWGYCGYGSVAAACAPSGYDGGCYCRRECCLKRLCHHHRHRGCPTPCFLPCAAPCDGGFDWDDCSCDCCMDQGRDGGSGGSGCPQCGGAPDLGAPPLAPKAAPTPPASGGGKPR